MAKEKKNNRLIINLASLIIVFLLMALAAVSQSGRLLGHDFRADAAPSELDSSITVGTDGSVTVNTSSLETGAPGYGGPVAVEIRIVADTVAAIEPLENSETPRFFKKVLKSGLIESWIGLPASEASALQPDAVTGATYSSTALIRNVQAGLAEYEASRGLIFQTPEEQPRLGAKFWAALAVVLMAMILPLLIHDRRYRIAQQLLNVGVLGFWTGTFLDYTMFMSLMSNGIGSLSAAASMAVLLLMLAAGFIYPLFGKLNHYCNWVCPLGSLQELVGDLNPRHKWHMSPAVTKWLGRLRVWLWIALMICLWTGFLASWIDYELFTAFMVEEAMTSVLIAAAAIALLSLFIPRPYCRFVCPTGTLMREAQHLTIE